MKKGYKPHIMAPAGHDTEENTIFRIFMASLKEIVCNLLIRSPA